MMTWEDGLNSLCVHQSADLKGMCASEGRECGLGSGGGPFLKTDTHNSISRGRLGGQVSHPCPPVAAD